MKRSTFLRGMALLPLASHSVSRSQTPASKSISIVVPYTAGGPTDAATRLVAEELARRTGHTFVVQNKPGAATIIGTESVRGAPKDGATWLLATPTTFSLNPILYKNLKYGRDDFAAIGAVAKVPYGVTVGSAVPAKTMQEFAAWARTKDKPFSYGTVGQGSVPHIVGAAMARTLGVKSLAVHYKGSAPVQADLLGGVIDMSIDPLTTALQMHKAGRARIIGVIDDVRWPDLPDVATMQEQGLPGVQGSSWLGFFAPAGTPAAALASMSNALASINSSPEIQTRLRAVGLSPLPLTLPQFEQMIARDALWWKNVVEENKIQLEQ